MRLALETWQTSDQTGNAEELGMSRLTIGDREYRSLDRIERQLREGDQREARVAMQPSRLNLETPPGCGPLAECQLRVYLREEDDTGHFQLLGTRAGDGGSVYTKAVMLRTVAL